MTLTSYGLYEVGGSYVINNGGSEPVAEGFIALAYAGDVVTSHRTDNSHEPVSVLCSVHA
jgi:hypothetical protein